MHEFRQAALLGIIVGIVLEMIGIASLTNYYANAASFNFIISGCGLVVVGSMFLAIALPVFIPLKKQKSTSRVCSNCNVILAEDSMICEKCKQPIEDNEH